MNDQSKWALVTGASSGIGQAIAIGLARSGWNLVINHWNDETGARQTSEQVEQAGRKFVIAPADVGSASEVDSMFERVAGLDGPLDVVVNNAGVQTWASFMDLKEEDWDRTIRTNLKGTFLCSQRALAR